MSRVLHVNSIGIGLGIGLGIGIDKVLKVHEDS